MKRFLKALISVMLVVCFLAGTMPEPFVASSADAIQALAEEAKARSMAESSGAGAGVEAADGDGWIYRICPDGYAELIGYADETATSLALPDALGGAWVVRLAEDAFADNPNLRSVTIPAQIDEIPDSAFPNGEGLTVRAYNGTAALAFASKRGFEVENRSSFDLFDGVLDLSDMKTSQWSLSGSALRLEEPYSRLAKDGQKLYLPPRGEHLNGMAVELSDCRTEGSGAVARCVELSFAEAIESYHAEDMRLYPDLSSFRGYSEGVELVTKPQARAVGDMTANKAINFSLDYKLNKYLSVTGKVELSTSVTVSVDYENYRIRRLEYENTTTTTFGTGLKLNNKSEDSLNLPVGYIPAGEVRLGGLRLVSYGVVSAWLELSLVITAEGEVRIESTITTTDRLTYIDGAVTKGHTHDVNPPSWSVQVGASIALKAALVVRLGLDVVAQTTIDVLELAVLGGYEAKTEVDFDDACIDVKVDAFYKVTFEVGLLNAHILGIDLKWEEDPLFNQYKISDTLKEYRETKLELHFESDNGKMTGKWSRVPECTRDRVKVHFYLGYGSAGAVPDQEVKRGDTLNEPYVAPRNGYSFQGWYMDLNHVVPWDFANDYVQEEMTLYADWVKEPEPENPGGGTVEPGDGGSGKSIVNSYIFYDFQIFTAFYYDITSDGLEITDYRVSWNGPYDSTSRLEDEIYRQMEIPRHVTVPSMINGMPVTSIGSSAFTGSSINITGITLPDTVKVIKSGAFEGNPMSSIRLPAGLKELPSSVFANCNNLTGIALPNGLTRIGENAFVNCGALRSINLPDSITFIDDFAFSGTSITSITTPVSWGKDTLTDKNAPVNNVSPFGQCATLTSVIVPEGTEVIPDNAFYECVNVASIQLPSTLKRIGKQAFMKCSSLQEITLPDGIEDFGRAIFWETNISEVRIPSKWMKSYHHKNFDHNYNSPFYGCAGLQSIIVPEGITVIPDYFFENDNVFGEVTNIQLPSSLEKIGFYAFNGCASLSEIAIPDGVKAIGESAFRNTGLQSVRLPSSWEEVLMEHPEYNWANSPFYECYELMYVEIPDGVKEIPAYAFALGCGENATIQLPSTLKVIGRSAFDGAKFGPSLTIPASVEAIGPDALRNSNGCYEEIIFEGDVGYIDDNAFSGASFEQVYVHENCENVRNAIQGHATQIVFFPGALHNVYLRNTGDSPMPGTMARSGARISDPGAPSRQGFSFLGWFRDAACTRLWDFESDTMPDADLTLYAGWESDSSVYRYSKVDGGVTIESYEGDSSTLALPNVLGGLPVTAIAAEAIPNGVRTLTIPAGVAQIDPRAFVFAEDLVEIRVDASNNTYRSAGGVLFRGDELVAHPRSKVSERYEIPAGTTAIGSYAFYRCGKLTQLCVPASVRTLGESAIRECDALESVEFEKDVERIGEGNLLGCGWRMNVTGPMSASKLSAYADENELNYNVFRLALVRDGALIAILSVHAGESLDGLPGLDDDAGAFLGWTGSEDGGDIWDLSTAVMPAGDLILYAVMRCPFDYESADGGVRLTKYTGGASRVRVPDAVDDQPVVDIADGCFPDKNVTLVADRGSVADAYAQAHGMNFEPITYTLHFETNGGRKVPDRTLCATDPIDLPTTTRDGGTFDCWCSDESLVNPWNDGDPMPAHDLTLYARWSVEENWVDFPFDFDEVDGSVVITEYTGGAGSVNVPESINGMRVTEIAASAFAGSEVRDVMLPASVERIGEEAFAGSALSSIRTSATSIGANAFRDCTALTSATIEGNLTELGAGAFRNCSALTDIALPNSLTELGEYAFSGCDWLTSATLPANLSAIPAGAFLGCRRLTAIQIGAQVSEIAADAFSGCTALAEISVAGGNMYYKAESNVLLNASGTQLMLYPQGRADAEYTIPGGVTVIADGAMKGAKMKTLRLNAELERIGADALRDCAYLERIDMNGALDSIGARAFSGCVNLADVTLPEGLAQLGEETFAAAGLTRIYVPEQAQLGKDAIPALAGLTIYGHRGSAAESYAQSHGIRFVDESSDIPVTDIAISTDTLELEPGQTETLTATLTPGDTTEREIRWSSDNEAVAFVSQSGEVEARGVGEAVIRARAANGATAQCALRVTRQPVQATEIVLSPQELRLGVGDLRSVTATVLPAGADDAAVTWSIENPEIAGWIGGCVIGKSIGETRLTATTAGGLSASCSITVVEYVELIPMDAPDFLLPDSLTTIEDEAFSGLAMTVVRCPSGLREIGSRAFAGCGKLRQIYIPPSTTIFAEDAFDGCSENLIIYGEVGSAAENYAEAHGYSFREMA